MALSGKKSLCVITGASRGIGREIAVQLAQSVATGSVFLLTARQLSKLHETAKLVSDQCSGAVVRVLSADLSHIDGHLTEFRDTLSELIRAHGPLETAILVHNAGSLGDMERRMKDLDDGDRLRRYLDENVVSLALLNAAVLQVVTNQTASTRIVVNITSLAAVKGFPSFGYYSAGKAAREGLLRVLAAEEKDLRVLNYSPGPVQTDMIEQVAQQSHDADIRQTFSSKKSGSEVNRMMLSAETTVKKLMRLMDEDKYESGSRTDYFDE